MKKLLPALLVWAVIMPVLGGIEDDGVISHGEYFAGAIEWSSNEPPLVIDGGGVNWMGILDFGKLEVHSTSTPLNGDWHAGGIRDISMDDDSTLLYLNGITDLLTMRNNSTAVIKGGSINHIRTYFRQSFPPVIPMPKHIDLFCRPGWSWLQEDEDLDGDMDIVGITGLWQDNSAFTIGFINKEDFDPVWETINVIVVPEPASLLLITAGGLLIRRRR